MSTTTSSYEKVGTLGEEKYQATNIAKTLEYTTIFPEIITKINCAKSVTEVHNILASARRAC